MSLKYWIASLFRRLLVRYYRMCGVRIGKGVFISYTAKIDTTYPDSVWIADGCYITYGAIILAHDHSVYRHTSFEVDNGRGVVRLGRNVFVGSKAIIMRNVTVGENSIIAAGAVVTCDVPANAVVGGNPARFIKSFTPRS